MFRVLDITFDNNVFCEKMLLRSWSEKACWDLIANRLTSIDARVRQQAHNLIVVDDFGDYCDAPENVLALYNRKELVS